MIYAIDCETTSLNPHTGGRAFLITWCSEDGVPGVCRVGIDDISIVRALTDDATNEFIMHNAGFDFAFLKNLDVVIQGTLHDTIQ